jgi:hypothetical protein
MHLFSTGIYIDTCAFIHHVIADPITLHSFNKSTLDDAISNLFDILLLDLSKLPMLLESRVQRMAE